MDAFFNWLSSNSLAANTIIISFGALVSVAILAFLIAFFQGREISLWHFKIGPTPEKAKKWSGKVKQNKDNHSADYLASNPMLKDAKLVQVCPPISPTKFQTLNLPIDPPENNIPHYYGWTFAPIGIFMIYDVPFYLDPVVDGQMLLGHRVIQVKPKERNARSVLEVNSSVQNISNIYFLISASHGHVIHEGVHFLGKEIGYIELIFSDNTRQKIELILGENIREWHFGWSTNMVNKVNFEIVRPAWVSHDNERRIDFLEVGIDDSPKNLEKIKIVAQLDTNQPEKPIDYPGIIISAITCEMG